MQPMSDSEYQDVLLGLTPRLRAFARMLSGTPPFADDLVHQTLAQAWALRDSAPAQSEMAQWLFRLLRDYYYVDARKGTLDTAHDEDLSQDLADDFHPLQSRVGKALSSLPDFQREVLILFVANSFNYRQVSQIVGCAVGTVKSRLSRARKRMLEIDSQAVTDFIEESRRATSGADARYQFH